MGHEDLRLLDIGDLIAVQGHCGLAFEDRNEDNQLSRFLLDFGNRRRHGLEWTVVDGNRFSDLKIDGDFGDWRTAWLGSRWLFDRINHGVLQHGEHFVKVQRVRIVSVSYEAGDAWSVSNYTPRSVGQFHTNQDVARDTY